jgi:hypothetical protein
MTDRPLVHGQLALSALYFGIDISVRAENLGERERKTYVDRGPWRGD